jgi:phosphate transport system substrate-binding protein
LLYHHGDQAVSVPRLYVNTEKLEEGIAIDPSGLGVSLLSMAQANRGIKMLTVEGYAASDTSVADGTYPLYSPLFLASREDSKNHEAVAKFVAYATSDAAKPILRKHELVPYADAPALVSKADERVAYVDAKIHPEVAVMANGTPVSAPGATADFLQRTEPTSERAVEAKARAERLRTENAEKAEAEKAQATPRPADTTQH